MQDPTNTHYDAIIIGGGPAGATAGLVLARAGLRSVILEKAKFPRFHIGESLLPRNFALFDELGIADDVRKLPHVPKYGVEFAMGNDPKTVSFGFEQSLLPGVATLNIERAAFDQMLLNHAAAAGAEVREGTGVAKIEELADGAVRVRTDPGDEIRGKFIIDASGQGTVVAKHLGTRRGFKERDFQKVAYFNHFESVERRCGREGGYPCIAMADEGWFWMIPLTETKTSIGFVAHPDTVKQAGVPANQMLRWAIDRCPLLRDRMKKATGPETNMVCADYSYSCKPFAGPGYFLTGDAATFLDPIFSTGVCLAMMSGREAANQLTAIVKQAHRPATARGRYIGFVSKSTGLYFSIIRGYYRHTFREMFLSGGGPLKVHRAILAILAGQVFPKPAFCLRWRLWLFNFLLEAGRFFQIVPARKRFSLLRSEPMPAAMRVAV